MSVYYADDFDRYYFLTQGEVNETTVLEDQAISALIGAKAAADLSKEGHGILFTVRSALDLFAEELPINEIPAGEKYLGNANRNTANFLKAEPRMVIALEKTNGYTFAPDISKIIPDEEVELKVTLDANNRFPKAGTLNTIKESFNFILEKIGIGDCFSTVENTRTQKSEYINDNIEEILKTQEEKFTEALKINTEKRQAMRRYLNSKGAGLPITMEDRLLFRKFIAENATPDLPFPELNKKTKKFLTTLSDGFLFDKNIKRLPLVESPFVSLKVPSVDVNHETLENYMRSSLATTHEVLRDDPILLNKMKTMDKITEGINYKAITRIDVKYKEAFYDIMSQADLLIDQTKFMKDINPDVFRVNLMKQMHNNVLIHHTDICMTIHDYLYTRARTEFAEEVRQVTNLKPKLLPPEEFKREEPVSSTLNSFENLAIRLEQKLNPPEEFKREEPVSSTLNSFEDLVIRLEQKLLPQEVVSPGIFSAPGIPVEQTKGAAVETQPITKNTAFHRLGINVIISKETTSIILEKE